MDSNRALQLLDELHQLGAHGVELGFAFIIQWWVPVTLFFGIILFGVWQWFRLKRAFRRVLWDIRAARGLIESCANAEEFAARYETISERLSADRTLSHTWREFSETLIPPDGPNHRVRNTSRPDNYFHADLLNTAGINMRFYQALPNYLVGVGLLFTFIGLIAALYFAGKGVASANVQDAQASLRELLEAATFKFGTSVAGLGTSIWFSIKKKGLLHSLDTEIQSMCYALERRLDFVTPVTLAIAGYHELQAQTTQLEKFNTDLAFSIAEALDKKFSDNLGRVMAPVLESLEKMASKLGEMNQSALEQMIGKFSEKLEGAAGQQIDSLITGLQGVRGTIGDLIAGVGRVNEGLAQQIEQSAKDLSSRIGDAAGVIEGRLVGAGQILEERIGLGAENLKSAFAAAGASLDAAVGSASDRLRSDIGGATEKLSAALMPLGARLSELDTTLHELDQQFGQQRANLTALATQHASAARSMADASAPLGAAAEQVQSCCKRLEALTEGIAKANETLASGAAALEGSATQVRDVWQSYRGHFESLDEDLSRMFGELSSGLDAFRTGVEKFVGQVDAGMSRSVASLSAAIQELNGTAEQLAVGMKSR
jgi:ABC-type transporter Mla subunit MlaD